MKLYFCTGHTTLKNVQIEITTIQIIIDTDFC